MRVFWHNGALCAEPESPVESEALLLLARSLRYELPDGYDEDGRHEPKPDASGSCNAGELL